LLRLINQKAFSLIEVLIALTLFAVFVTVYMTSQGYNLTDSIMLKEENTLRVLAERTYNEIYLNPPEFNDALENRKDKKSYEDDDYKDYEYIIEYKKFDFPDLSNLIGDPTQNQNQNQTSGQDRGMSQNVRQDDNLKKIVFERLKENLDRMIWQVRVTVRNKNTDQQYFLAGWIQNHQAQIMLNIGI